MSKKKLPSVTVRVAKGAAYLDRVKPDWFNAVNLDTLQMSNGCHCVLGQCYGSYWRAPLLGSDPFHWRAWERSAAHGFMAPRPRGGRAARPRCYSALAREWKDVIHRRRSLSPDGLRREVTTHGPDC